MWRGNIKRGRQSKRQREREKGGEYSVTLCRVKTTVMERLFTGLKGDIIARGVLWCIPARG